MLTRRFFYVSLGILALSIAYHLGAATVGAQGGGGVIAVLGNADPVSSGYSIITHDGDVWWSQNGFDPRNASHYPWTFGGNIFFAATGVPQAQPQPGGWGKLKGSFGR